jgi:mannose-6-phosphate isomerase-like protein (cupin superfamily)
VDTISTVCDRNRGHAVSGRRRRSRIAPAVDLGRRAAVELKRYDDAATIQFGNLMIRDMTPSMFSVATFTEIEVPIGADNPPYAAEATDKVYVGVSGDIEFAVGDETVRVGPGDVLVIHTGESFRYHNGGYAPGRLFLIQVPGASG